MTIDTSTDVFKARSDMPLEIAMLEDACPEFTQMVDVQILETDANFRCIHIRPVFRGFCASFIE
jgi:hypothetical protein